MVSEIFEVLDIQGGQGQVVVQAARAYPHVILRAGSATPTSVRGNGTPGASDVLDLVVVRQDQNVAQPGVQAATVGKAPLAIDGPLGQLRQRDERDAQLVVKDGLNDGGW